jgi:AcrR family transcriptional regulator
MIKGFRFVYSIFGNTPFMTNSNDHSYHHGDLRHALIQAALAFVNEGDANFTLRSVARRAGVSHAAPYNHFKDKQELLFEVAAVGFEKLRAALEKIAPDFTDPKSLFLMRWRVFLNFAVSNPEHYRLMIGPVKTNTEYPRLTQAAKVFYDVLLNDLELFARQGFFAPERVASNAVIISSQLHGLAMLAIDGRLKWHDEDLDTLAERSISVLLRGMNVID